MGAVLTTGLVGVWPLWDWQPQYWGRLDLLMRERMWPALIVVSFPSAWEAQSIRQPSVVIPRCARRSVVQVSLVWIVKLLALTYLGISLVVSVATFRLAAVGAFGTPPVLPVLASLAAVGVAVPIGFAFGVLLPRFGWPVAVPLLSVVVLFAPFVVNEALLVNSGLSTRSLSIVWGLPLPQVGWSTPNQVALLRLSYFLLIGVGAVAAVAAWNRLPRARRALGTAIILAGTGFLMAVTAWVSPRLPLVHIDSVAPACADLAVGSRVCVHPAHSALLKEIGGPIEKMLAVLPAQLRPVEFAAQAYLPPGETSRTFELPASLPGTKASYLSGIANDLARKFNGESSCNDRLDEAYQKGILNDRDLSVSLDFSRAIAQRLVVVAGLEPIPVGVSEVSGKPVMASRFDALAKLSDAQFSAWFAIHAPEIAACTLTDAALP